MIISALLFLSILLWLCVPFTTSYRAAFCVVKYSHACENLEVCRNYLGGCGSWMGMDAILSLPESGDSSTFGFVNRFDAEGRSLADPKREIPEAYNPAEDAEDRKRMDEGEA